MEIIMPTPQDFIEKYGKNGTMTNRIVKAIRSEINMGSNIIDIQVMLSELMHSYDICKEDKEVLCEVITKVNEIREYMKDMIQKKYHIGKFKDNP